MEPAYAALPQRAPRLRRQDVDSAQCNTAAEPSGGSEKRARDAAEPSEEAELARQSSRRSEVEQPGTAAVVWSEADAAAHYECACPRVQRRTRSTGLLTAARARLRRPGPHGGHSAPRMCVCGASRRLKAPVRALTRPRCARRSGPHSGGSVRLDSAVHVQLHGAQRSAG